MHWNSLVILKQRRKRTDSQGWLASSSSVSHPVSVSISQSVCLCLCMCMFMSVSRALLLKKGERKIDSFLRSHTRLCSGLHMHKHACTQSLEHTCTQHTIGLRQIQLPSFTSFLNQISNGNVGCGRKDLGYN